MTCVCQSVFFRCNLVEKCFSFFQESSEDVSGGLPFLADLALGLSVLACSMLRILYNGPEVTREEEACHDLLCSKLLQR